MDTSDQLLQEIEIHVQRILEGRDSKEPGGPGAKPADKGTDLMNALRSFIDQRIEEQLKTLRAIDRCRPAF